MLRRITDYANRANPYPLYAELRQHGVARQDDGSFPVGTYHEIAALLHDPRISSDHRNRTGAGDIPQARGYIDLDAPEHERLNGIGRRPVQVTI